MHWLQRKKRQVCEKSHFVVGKNQEKLQQNWRIWKKGIFAFIFFIFFAKWDLTES